MHRSSAFPSPARRAFRLALLLSWLILAVAAPAAAQDRGLVEGTVTLSLYDEPDLTDFLTSRPWSGTVDFDADCIGEQHPFAGCELDPALADGAAYSARWTASLLIPVSGLYTFDLTADDGARLFVDGDLVTDTSWNFPAADDLPPPQSVTLDDGEHAFRLEYMQRFPFAASLELRWAGPGFAFEPVPTVEVEPEEEDLLVNGGFEAGLTGWSVGPSGSSVGGGAHCGDLALKLGPGPAKTWQRVGPAGVEPGGLYVLEGFTRLVSASPAGVELAFLDAARDTLARSIWPMPVGAAFEPFELVAAAPPGTEEIEVAIKARRVGEAVDLTVDCLRLTHRRLDAVDDPAFDPRDLQAAVGGDLTCTGSADQDDRQRCAVVVYQRLFAVWPLAREITLGDVLGFVYYREMHLLFGLGDAANDVAREAFFRNFWEVVDGTGGSTGVTPLELVRFLGEKQGWYGLANFGNPLFGSATVTETLDVVDADFRAAFDAYRAGLVTNRPFDWGNWARGRPGYESISDACIDSLIGDPQGNLPGAPLVVHFCSEATDPPYDYYFAVLTKAQDLEMPPTSGCGPDCVPPPGSCPALPVTLVQPPIGCPAPPAP